MLIGVGVVVGAKLINCGIIKFNSISVSIGDD
jgi:hypothetical protein